MKLVAFSATILAAGVSLSALSQVAAPPVPKTSLTEAQQKAIAAAQEEQRARARERGVKAPASKEKIPAGAAVGKTMTAEQKLGTLTKAQRTELDNKARMFGMTGQALAGMSSGAAGQQLQAAANNKAAEAKMQEAQAQKTGASASQAAEVARQQREAIASIQAIMKQMEQKQVEINAAATRARN